MVKCGVFFLSFFLSYGRAVAKIVNEHFSAMRGVPPGFSCCPSGDGEEGVAQFDSDYSGGEGASPLFFL